jgi:predicted acyltransferase
MLAVSVTPGGETGMPLKSYLFLRLFRPWLDPHSASLAYAAAYLLLWTVMMYVLYRKKIFIRL